MPRQRIDPFWRNQVFTARAQSPGRGPGPIFSDLQQKAGELGREDYPSERTIARLLEEFRRLPDREQRTYEDARWPESFEARDLPWEAGAAVVELLKAARERPSVRLARWFWRVTLAAPTLPVEQRRRAARALEYVEVGYSKDPDSVNRAVEGLLLQRAGAADALGELAGWHFPGLGAAMTAMMQELTGRAAALGLPDYATLDMLVDAETRQEGQELEQS